MWIWFLLAGGLVVAAAATLAYHEMAPLSREADAAWTRLHRELQHRADTASLFAAWLTQQSVAGLHEVTDAVSETRCALTMKASDEAMCRIQAAIDDATRRADGVVDEDGLGEWRERFATHNQALKRLRAAHNTAVRRHNKALAPIHRRFMMRVMFDCHMRDGLRG